MVATGRQVQLGEQPLVRPLPDCTTIILYQISGKHDPHTMTDREYRGDISIQ